jgi:hypothetical protein
MTALPRTDVPLLLRTDFTDDSAWGALLIVLAEGDGEFCAHVSPVSDRRFDGAHATQLVEAAAASGHTFFLVADSLTFGEREKTLLVVDAYQEPERTFRVMLAEAAAVENNLSIANMEFAEFANAAGEDGVFRGFPRSS